MSATMYPYMPTIGNPSPWEQALATTKQDTGWSGPSAQVPYSAPSTMGGGTWNLPDWAWGGNQLGGGTYDQATGTWRAGAPLAAGADVYGAKLPVGYNSAGDRGGLEYNGQHGETFWSRMLRFARDYTMGGVNPQQAMQQALDRIRRDNGGTLAGTGFDEGGGIAAPASGLPNGGMSVDYGTQGGGTVADVNGGGGYAPPVPTTVVKQGANNPTTQGARFGQFQTPDLVSVLAEIQADPSKAAMVWRMMNGQTVTPLGRMADTRNSLYGKSLQALLGLGGLPGMGSSEDLLAGFYDQTKAGGPGLLGLGNSVAGKLGGMDLGALKSEDLDMLLSTLASLQGLNMGKIGRSGMATQLENVINQDWARNATGGVGADAGNYAGDLDNTGYGRSLSAYLGLQ
jgi:hypothetical protein